MQEDNLFRPGAARGVEHGAGGRPAGRGDVARA